MTPPTSPPLKVLLVEDNPADARLVLELLRESGTTWVTVTHADRLERAMEELQNGHFEAILLDLNLPDSDGLETLARAHGEAFDVPILVVTGISDEDVAAAAVRAGAQDYLIKGKLDAEVLRRAIRYAVERKEAEATIRWLTLAVEQSPAAVFMTDLDGTIRYVNRTFTQVTGYEPGEAIGRTPSILKAGGTPPETYRALWDTVLAGSIWSGELWNLRKNGERYLDAVLVSPIRDPHGTITHLLGVHEEITARHAAEIKIQRSEERFRRLVENATDSITLLDADGLVSHKTEALAPALGYPLGELSGHSAFDLIHPDDLRTAEQMIAAVLSDPDHPARGELRGCHKDGSWRDLEAIAANHLADPAIEAIVVTFRDVTEQKAAEVALRESEARFRQMAEHINEAFFVLELPSRTTSYLSPIWSELLGRPLSDIIDFELILNAVHVEDHADAVRTLEKVFGGEAVSSTFRIVRSDGAPRWVRGRAFPVLNEAGEVYRVVGVVEDITMLRRAEEHFAQAQKLEAVGRLAGGVAHDFNNMLTVILGEVAMMKELPLKPLTREGLEAIDKAAQSAVSLTRQLLTFSRRQLIEPTVFDLNAVVSDTARMLQRLIGEDVRLATELAHGGGMIKADRGQIEQVLANLVVNARDAMPNGGTITITTEGVRVGAAEVALFAKAPPGLYILLAVTDTGTGMTEAVRAQAFEPFFTTKDAGKGTGLGLATCYGIVTQNDGHIAIVSEEGVGTTVSVLLPSTDIAPSVREERRLGILTGGGETILLVEDDEAVRRIGARILQRLGYRVSEAADALAALAILDTTDEHFDLLLTDVVMPGMGGRELADTVRQMRPDIKTLFASGYSEDMILQNRLLEHEVTVIQKPYSIEGLARSVRHALDKRVVDQP